MRKNVADNQILLIVEEALRGRAKIWLETRLCPFMGYNSFRAAFIKNFYSIDARIQAKRNWTTRRFRVTDKSLYEYFIEQVKAPTYIAPDMDTYEINYTVTVIKQLPARVQDFLATIDFNDTEKIAQALVRLDTSQMDRNIHQERQPNPTESRPRVNSMRKDQRNKSWQGGNNKYNLRNNEIKGK